jgi:hypothetical protein
LGDEVDDLAGVLLELRGFAVDAGFQDGCRHSQTSHEIVQRTSKDT